MTVNTTIQRQYFDGDGLNKNFPFNFKFFDNSTIYVATIDSDGDVTGLTEGINYTLTGAGSSNGGKVVLNFAPGVDFQVMIERVLPDVQTTSFRNQGAFYPAIHEDAFDKLVMLVQQALAGNENSLKTDRSGRFWDFQGKRGINAADPVNNQDVATKGWIGNYIDSVSGLINTTTGISYDAGTLFDYLRDGVDRTVPSIAALKALSTTRNRTATVQNAKFVSFYRFDPASVDTVDNATVIAPNSGTGRWLINHNGTMTLFQWGAVGDDASDDTVPIQGAASWTDATGLTAIVPAVAAAFRTTAPINAKSPRFVGQGCIITTNGGGNTNPRGKGSWFHFDHTGRGFNCNAGSFIAGYPLFEKIGTIRNQPTPNGAASFTPTNNDFDFYLWNCDSTLTDFVTLNATRGIFVSADPAASQSRTTINGWRGQPLTAGIQVDFSADIVRTSNVHLWPYWSTAQGVYNHMLVNGAAYLSGRNDNPMLEGFFTIYYGYGISVYQTAQGTTNKMAGTNVDIDGSGVAWLYAASGVSGFSAKFTNCDAQGVTGTTSLYGIYLHPASNGCTVSLVNCAMGVYADSAIHNLGVNNTVKLASTTLFSWNGSNGGFPAVSLGVNSVLEFSASQFAAPFFAAANFSVDGIVKGIGSWQTYTGTTDANGDVNIPHSFGHTPSGALATSANAGVSLNVSSTNLTPSATVFRVRTTSTGAALVSAAVAFPYMLFF